MKPSRPVSRTPASTGRKPPLSTRFRSLARKPAAKVTGMVASAVLAGALAGGIHGARSLPKYVEENRAAFAKLEQSLKPTDIQEAHRLSATNTAIDTLVENVVRDRKKMEAEFAERQKREKERGVILEPPWALSETDNQLARMTPAEAESFLRKNILFRRMDTNPERRAEFFARLASAAKLREAYADYLSGRKNRDTASARSRATIRGVKTGAYTSIPLSILLTALYFRFRRKRT